MVSLPLPPTPAGCPGLRLLQPVVSCLILLLYRHQVVGHDGPRRHRIAAFIETTGQRGIALLGGAFVIIVALLLTGSRGGMIAAASGLVVLGILTLRRNAEQFKIMALAIVLVATVCIGFGATV